VVSVLYALPDLGAVRWARSISFLELAVAVLAGVGADAVIRTYRNRAVLRLFGTVFALAGLSALVIWAMRPREGHVRAENLVWAGAGAALGLGLIGVLAWARRRTAKSAGLRRFRSAGVWAATAMFAFEAAFLVTTGSSQWSSNSSSFTSTPAERQLGEAVGSSLVAFGSPACNVAPLLGIPANTNIVFGIHELAAYDPMLPRSYYQAWAAATGRPGGYPRTSRYCPGVTSATLARRYGVAYVLEVHGAPGPKGAVFDQVIGSEDLYRIPGAATATLVPLGPSGRPPGADAVGTPVPVVHPEARSWKVQVDTARTADLRLRLTDVPGWHATIDGRPLTLESFSTVMLEARVPAGRHIVTLSYWPTSFSVGIALSVMGVIGLMTALVVGARRNRPTDRHLPG
jgi:hypothetical protein